MNVTHYENATNCCNYINLTKEQLEIPIYRIYPLHRFKKLLKSKVDALVNPSKWDDPFENFLLTRTKVVTQGSNGVPETGSLEGLAKDWYGQCWSMHEETDACGGFTVRFQKICRKNAKK